MREQPSLSANDDATWGCSDDEIWGSFYRRRVRNSSSLVNCFVYKANLRSKDNTRPLAAKACATISSDMADRLQNKTASWSDHFQRTGQSPNALVLSYYTVPCVINMKRNPFVILHSIFADVILRETFNCKVHDHVRRSRDSWSVNCAFHLGSLPNRDCCSCILSQWRLLGPLNPAR